MSHLNVLSQHSHGANEENNEESIFITDCNTVRIQIEELSARSLVTAIPNCSDVFGILYCVAALYLRILQDQNAL